MQRTLLLAALCGGAAGRRTQLEARSRHLQHATAQRRAQAEARDAAVPPDQYWTQVVDHFDPLNAATWQQRFWVNAEFVKDAATAPVFLYVEGEGAGSPYDVLGGEHVELAQTYGALVVALEHRFYGASIPTPDLSTANLRVLSSHQAVADVSTFITQYLQPTFNVTPAVNKIVTFGGSYPGALSAWLRLRLPHLIHTALSTSSPVQAQLNFRGYNDVVAASLADPQVGGSPACTAAVAAAFQAVDAAFTGTPAQRDAMAAKLHSCAPLTGVNDTMWAASNYAGVLMEVVQYNMEIGGLDIASVCSTMTAPGVKPIDALASVVGTFQNGACMDNSYADFVAQTRNVTANKAAGGVGIRQWTWQTCVQFGYYQTCEDASCPFSRLMTLESSLQQCVDLFDGPASFWFPEQPAAVARTNALLGGQAMRGSRIIFINGSIDPWHALSLINGTASEDRPTVFIQGTAHCRNMQPSAANDPPALVAARKQIDALLAAFLQQPL